MNFRDKIFVQSFALLMVSITGLVFPSFVKYLFGLGALAGLVGIIYWYKKEKKK